MKNKNFTRLVLTVLLLESPLVIQFVKDKKVHPPPSGALIDGLSGILTMAAA